MTGTAVALPTGDAETVDHTHHGVRGVALDGGIEAGRDFAIGGTTGGREAVRGCGPTGETTLATIGEMTAELTVSMRAEPGRSRWRDEKALPRRSVQTSVRSARSAVGHGLETQRTSDPRRKSAVDRLAHGRTAATGLVLA